MTANVSHTFDYVSQHLGFGYWETTDMYVCMYEQHRETQASIINHDECFISNKTSNNENNNINIESLPSNTGFWLESITELRSCVVRR